MTRLEQQMQFIMEIDKLKGIVRQNYLIHSERKENDAEHSWHMALMCVLLSEYSNESIDLLKTMTMILIHDIIEIDAGDTYAYDSDAHTSKKDRELAAADRIFKLLPGDQAEYLRGLWDEFEEGSSAEAKYAAVIDRLQPLILNSASNGRSWKEHNVRRSQVLKRNEQSYLGSEKLWEYAYEIINMNTENGNLINE